MFKLLKSKFVLDTTIDLLNIDFLRESFLWTKFINTLFVKGKRTYLIKNIFFIMILYKEIDLVFLNFFFLLVVSLQIPYFYKKFFKSGVFLVIPRILHISKKIFIVFFFFRKFLLQKRNYSFLNKMLVDLNYCFYFYFPYVSGYEYSNTTKKLDNLLVLHPSKQSTSSLLTKISNFNFLVLDNSVNYSFKW